MQSILYFSCILFLIVNFKSSLKNLCWLVKVLAEYIHHNLFITLILGSKAETIKQPCYIQTKMYNLYRKMIIYVIFLYNLYIFGIHL